MPFPDQIPTDVAELAALLRARGVPPEQLQQQVNQYIIAKSGGGTFGSSAPQPPPEPPGFFSQMMSGARTVGDWIGGIGSTPPDQFASSVTPQEDHPLRVTVGPVEMGPRLHIGAPRQGGPGRTPAGPAPDEIVVSPPRKPAWAEPEQVAVMMDDIVKPGGAVIRMPPGTSGPMWSGASIPPDVAAEIEKRYPAEKYGTPIGINPKKLRALGKDHVAMMNMIRMSEARRRKEEEATAANVKGRVMAPSGPPFVR